MYDQALRVSQIVSWLISVVLGIPVLGVIFAAIWSRRGERRPDRPGTRSVALFFGGDAYALGEELLDDERGEGLACAIAAAVNCSGRASADEPAYADHGWTVALRMGKRRACLRLGFVGDGAYEWMLSVSDPSSGGPAAAALLPLVDAALRSLTSLGGVSWHRRERAHANDYGGAALQPVD